MADEAKLVIEVKDDEDNMAVEEEQSTSQKKGQVSLLKDGEGFNGDDEHAQGEHAEEFYPYRDSPSVGLSASQKPKKSLFKRVKKHKKTILIALLLFIVGIVFLSVGIYDVQIGDKDRATAFFVIAALTIIPGAYQTYYIYRTLRGDGGYHFSQIPYANGDSGIN